MIEAYLFKMEMSGWHCNNPNCSHSLKYHNQILSSFHIKQGTTCLAVNLDSTSLQKEIYCRDCIDVIYQQLKPVLDSKLWIFQ